MTSPDDSDVPDNDALQAMRTELTRRINASPHPSLLINRLVAVDLRCAESAKCQARLILRAPRVLRVIRAELRQAFDLDPDTLLFTEPKPPAAAQKIDSLTDRALRLLVLPSVPINLNQFTVVSLKADPSRRLPFTPLEALRRVIALNLLARLTHVQGAYWQALEPGSWLTRKERWVELHKQLFADQAFVARQLNELSSAGALMVQAVVDASTVEARQRAGGPLASVQACELMWPGMGPRLMPIPGALHIYREGDPTEAPHVMYLPGANRTFYEYPSFARMQCGLVALINGALFDDLWQCLPLRRRHEVCGPAAVLAAARGLALRGDALTFSAQAVLEGQWENELACAVSVNLAQVFSSGHLPPTINAAPFLTYIERGRQHWVGKARLGNIRRELQGWDAHRRREEIIFASTAPTLAVNTVVQQLKRYEQGLMSLLDPQDPLDDPQAFRDFVALEAQCKGPADSLRALLKNAQLQLFQAAFWKARPDGKQRRLGTVIRAWTDTLRCAIQLQHRLGLIGIDALNLLVEVLDKPLASRRQGSDCRVLGVRLGNGTDATYPLHSVFAVTRAAAVRDHGQRAPVVLCAFGREGGVATFSRLAALSRSIKASLGSRDESILWRYVDRPDRNAVREYVGRQTLVVGYEPIEGNPVLLALKRLVKGYVSLQRSIDDRASIFSETQDAQLSRLLLAVELEEGLSAPVNAALIQARAHFDLVRKAAGARKKLPLWLAKAAVAQRNRFKHLQSRYLGNTWAFEEGLRRRLPDLQTFARSALVARLREDGLYPKLDIDTPFIELPDQVDGRFCGWDSACPVGDRNEILTPSTQRRSFSLLQLVLHNLDPQMMPTWWRFRYGRYLQAAWKQLLGTHYLVNMVSSLDVGGRYEALINKVFYPPPAGESSDGDARVPQLLQRALLTGTDVHLYSAIQQGLTASAQSLFNTAMAAETPEHLRKNGHQLQLYVVHLVGHTLQHDRYIGGILVIHDLSSLLCVVYWPTAPDTVNLTEHVSLQHAREYLNSMGARPDNVAALARHVAPGWAFEAITHHPGPLGGAPVSFGLAFLSPEYAMSHGVWRGAEFVRSFTIKHRLPTALVEEIEKQIHEQIASDSLNWLALVPTSHCDARALLYHARVLDQHHQAQANSNSGKTLEKYRELRLEEEKDTRRRALVSVFSPLFGLVNQLYELLLTSRRYHHSGEGRDAVDVAFGTLFLSIELLLTFVPGPKPKPGAVVRPWRRSLDVGLNRIHRSAAIQPGRVSRLPKSPSMVTRLKPVEGFRGQGVPADAVALNGLGEQGLYVARGEHFIVEGTHHFPVYRRGDEGFFRLKNKTTPGADELILTIYSPGEWLLGADAPVAGPSSGVLSPLRALAQPADWHPPIARNATENRIRQSSAPANYWSDWRIQVPENQSLGSSAYGVFHLHQEAPGFPYDAIYVGPRYDTPTHSGIGYYRLLHQGEHAPLDNIAFIARNEPLVSKAHVDIERWTGTALGEQPIPVSRTSSGQWQLHAPLFDGPLEPLIGRAFPTMTSKSREFALARVIELADASRSVTASHLLNLRATLDDWLTPNPVRLGQTDDLLKLLRPTERRGANLLIGYEGKAPGFTRVDFRPDVTLEPRLRTESKQLAPQRSTAQQAAVKAVLEGQGFSLHEWQVRRGTIRPNELIATHPRSNHLYYMTYQWLERGAIQLKTKLSDKWLNTAIQSHKDSVLAATVQGALDEQRLVRIVTGVQWPSLGNVPPTVYFVKVNPL
ncbi:hypothetical protein M2397_003711 [Pseudomonas sp. BIGb0381]|uniref:dermonecrotic toxin domain-containing protein n=1 Tax=Pseudomonas sp. BIGb0381 TaxID=2940608 RepID=UPI00286D85FC|nr:DUF6543 domain-containing protein [Pseudomonas sp. BIGb0381]MCS4313403.1 hypothetical protein [Pseudomonas sp. BIGb0381]